jgi:proliferating cell nuclear antigen
MVYILELKTTQAASIKIVTDAINSLLTDANFEFYPYYIDDNISEQNIDKTEYSQVTNNNLPSTSIATSSPIDLPLENHTSISDELQYSPKCKNEPGEKVKTFSSNEPSSFESSGKIVNEPGEKVKTFSSNEPSVNSKENRDSISGKKSKTSIDHDDTLYDKVTSLSQSGAQSSTNIIGNKKTIGGVVLKEVNKTGKILVYMRLDANKFDVYKYNYHKKKLTLGIDIGNLLKCLKCMSHFDTMSWLVDDDDINKLIVILESVEKREKKTFKLNLMDIEEETYDITPIQFPYSITLPSQDFHKYCKDMAASTDKIEIKATSKKLFFSGKGEIGNLEFEVGETNGGLSIISTISNINEIVQGLFELKFLLIFTKCTNLCNQVTLFLKNDYPIIVTYQIAALGEIKLVLSPSKSE